MIRALLGAGVMTLALAACSPAADEADAPAAEPSADAPTPDAIQLRVVRIGMDGPDLDACGSYGMAIGEDTPVYSAPGDEGSQVDRIGQQHDVVIGRACRRRLRIV